MQFEVEGPFEHFYLCHCKYCQKDTGSAHAANLFSTKARLIWLSGEEDITSFNIPSTQHIKSFCKHCGSATPNVQMNGKLLVVPAGSLDTEIHISPEAHIFCSSKALWDSKLELLPKRPQLP
ncbi:MAG: GFA family protein [Bdellovibrionales bacterium]|nr:GFA family protein [Bdellovibrionales bacterium]